MPEKNKNYAEPFKGKVQCPFQQVAGRSAQRILRIRRQPVETMASSWGGKGNR